METQLGMAHTIPRRRNTRMDFHMQNDKNAVIGMVDLYIETRTWNNTKPAPTT